MQALSRGQFLRRTAVAAGGLALLEPATALGRAAGEPRPIPGGFDASFTMVPSDPFIHVLPPGLGFEMSTITDFTGAVGGSEIRGTASGNGTTYSFDTDMRFMQGTYVDLDGRVQHGSFGFIWIDLFDADAVGDPEHQQHDLEPGIAQSGLFWTIPIDGSAVSVDPGRGTASLRAANVAVRDFHDVFNAFGSGPSVPAVVTFDVEWSPTGQPQRVRDGTFGFVGEYVGGSAHIDFTATVGGVTYRSNSAGQYNPLQPAVGTERNGLFFH